MARTKTASTAGTHANQLEDPTRLSVSLPVTLALLVAGVALLKISWDDYISPNATGPFSPEMVNLFANADVPLYLVEFRTMALSGFGMAALRYALNRWLKDEDASSVVALLFSVWLGWVGVISLNEMYSAGMPMEFAVQQYRLTIASQSNQSRIAEWATHMARVPGAGNVFNGYIMYELVWELALHRFSNPANIFHHTVFLLLSGGFCMFLCYSYLGMSFMIMEISTVPLKVRRLTFRTDYSGRPRLKRLNEWATLVFVASFVVTRIGHLAVAGTFFFGWMADGSLAKYSPGPTVDIAVAILLMAAFALQCFWLSLMLKMVTKGKGKQQRAH
jgi:hypothetical protein